MNLVTMVERGIALLFALCFSYQAFYLLWMIIKRKRVTESDSPFHKMAIVISARNEEGVIGSLLESINNQNYPNEYYKVFVVADNCTDQTAMVARSRGAAVFERKDSRLKGKGYALDYLFQKLLPKDDGVEAYLVIDADNILDRNYLREINKTFDAGYRIVTGYRNSKNYGSNWISAGHALWFIRESKYLNHARMILNTSCTVSGTGFLVKRDILKKNGGWKYHLLTEDIEFSVDQILKGETIGYCPDAVLYDEQPVLWSQSWNQRSRWSKGFYQVLGKYGFKLFEAAVQKPSFACFDMLMVLFPAIFLTLLSVLCYTIKIGYILAAGCPGVLITNMMQGILYAVVNGYACMFLIGAITTCSEWKKICCTPLRKIMYAFTFPLFMFTYAPLAIIALFKKVEWKPIHHTVIKNYEQIQELSRQ